jgi:hypothetical protein
MRKSTVGIKISEEFGGVLTDRYCLATGTCMSPMDFGRCTQMPSTVKLRRPNVDAFKSFPNSFGVKAVHSDGKDLRVLLPCNLVS